MKTTYLLYDSRYYDNPDRAMCYCVADTLKEANEDKNDMFPDAVIVKYDVSGNTLLNPIIIE